MKHRQILTSNYEEAETEIRRLDDIFHETVELVLQVSLWKSIYVGIFINFVIITLIQTFSTVPDVIKAHPKLQQLQKSLEVSYSGGGKGIQKEIYNVTLQTDKVSINQGL